MEIVLKTFRDNANSDGPTKVIVVGNNETITLSLTNPDRMITFDTMELAVAIEALHKLGHSVALAGEINNIVERQ